MREPNLCFPSQNRAAVCITTALYDRRALDCTATLPLINSLTHLAYLTSTSPRIREILILDGGLERLIRLLCLRNQPIDGKSFWKWALAFQCVVNVGVRGTEQIRTKVAEAGMIPIVLQVLDGFLKPENGNREKQNVLEQGRLSTHAGLPSTSTVSTMPATSESVLPTNRAPSDTKADIPLSPTHTAHTASSRSSRRRSTFPYLKFDTAQRRRNRQNRTSGLASTAVDTPDPIAYREEDILFALQLLAYLSKYPHIRDMFHTKYERNVFSVVERFCHRLHPPPIQNWAGVIMRNACRKDESQGGIRRCANMDCNKREKQPREFAKCRRCRKAKYCSKVCQSKAWSDGHRWWCLERPASSSTVNPVSEGSNNAANTTSTVAAATATTSTSPIATNAVTTRPAAPIQPNHGHSPSTAHATSVPVSRAGQITASLPAVSQATSNTTGATTTNTPTNNEGLTPTSANDTRRSSGVLNDLHPLPTHAHSDMTMIEPESSENRSLLMSDMSVHMEL